MKRLPIVTSWPRFGVERRSFQARSQVDRIETEQLSGRCLDVYNITRRHV
jgi:hypothetical protein